LKGSLTALLANPIAGDLSDRSHARWGVARRPWILAGALLAALGIVLLPQAATASSLVLWWCLAKLGLNTCMAALNGAVADQVPSTLQGRLWGWVGLAQPVGLVLGVGITSVLIPRIQLAASSQALLVMLCCLPVLLVVRGRPHAAEDSDSAGSPLVAFADPRFRGLWWSRFWLYLGWSMSTVYLLYFLEDQVRLPQAAALQALTMLLGVYAAGTVLSAALAGWASDACGQRPLWR
jgi:MFS family permease